MLQKINLNVTFLTGIILLGLSISNLIADDNSSTDKKEPKIVLPNDAVIIPYSPDNITLNKLPKPENLAESDQTVVVVPLDLHLDMLNLIKSADKNRIGEQRPSTKPVAITAAEYVAEELPQTGNELILNGKIHIYQYQNEGTLLPFQIQNSVIESPKLNNKPASISSTSSSQFVLHVNGKGEHIFTFKVRVKIQQQGGWRIAEGTLPTASSSKVQITLPSEEGDLLTGNPLDVRKWTSGKNNSGENKKITTTLEPNGNFNWRWRTAISEGQVDRSLEVESVIRFDLQDDAAWILWNPKFKISRGKWEMLRLKVPKNYTIAEVTGENVRGWNIVTKNNNAESDNSQTINIELLKPAEKEESLQVRLLKNEPDNKTDEKESWALSTLSVPEAGIHRGRIDLYRSSVREFRVTESKGAVLTDQPQTPNSSNDVSNKLNPISPLGLTPCQSYRFIAEPFELSLQTNPVIQIISISFQSILKVSHKQSLLETKVDIDSNNHPFFVTIKLPKQFNLKNVIAPQSIFYSKEKRNDENLLHVSHGNNPNGKVVIGLEGDYIPISPIDKIVENKNAADKSKNIFVTNNQQYQIDKLPSFSAEFAGVATNLVSKDATVELLTDPALRADAINLKSCYLINSQDLRNHISSPKEQRGLVRLIIKGVGGIVDAKLIFTEIEPDVQCSTITNVRTTGESIGETILLDFQINRAGIREIKFTLPEWMKDAVIESPFLQRKKIVEREIKDNSELSKVIDVTLELQESVIDHLRVLVRGDRKLRAEKDYRIFVPIIQTGTTTRQYIVMENDRMSPDEMIVDQPKIKNLKNLDRRQQEWIYLAKILGENVTEAYYVQKTNTNPVNTNPSIPNADKNISNAEASLTFKMKRRDAVRLSEARINKSETRLVFDSNGEYRAEQIYHIDNQQEPYLDIFLPDNATLWGVRFFSAEEWQQRDSIQQNNSNANADNSSIRCEGEPVKPCLMPYQIAATYDSKLAAIVFDLAVGEIPYYAKGVRIPLIKTESGDLDYVVRIVYGGMSRGLRNFTSAEMPFLKVMNIPVGTSLLKLYLPDKYKYYFSGNMQQVNKEQSTSIIKKINDEYTQRIGLRLQQTMQDSNVYARQRAFENIKNFDLGQNSVYSSGGEPQFQFDANTYTGKGIPPQTIQSPQPTQTPTQNYVPQVVQQHESQQNAFTSNSAMLRSQFENQSNTFSSQFVNKKSIEIQQPNEPSRKSNRSNSSSFNKEWLDSMSQKGGKTNDINADACGEVIIVENKEEFFEDKAMAKNKNSLELLRRSQAVVNGNLVLGDTKQIDRQNANAKTPSDKEKKTYAFSMHNEDSPQSSSTERGRQSGRGDTSPAPPQQRRTIEGRVYFDNDVNASSELPSNRDSNKSRPFNTTQPTNHVGLFPHEDKSEFSKESSVNNSLYAPIAENGRSEFSKESSVNNSSGSVSGGYGGDSVVYNSLVGESIPMQGGFGGGAAPNLRSNSSDRSRSGLSADSNSVVGDSNDSGGVIYSIDGKVVQSADNLSEVNHNQFRSLSTQMTGVDIEIPYKGELYVFTTPQGSLDLSFRAASSEVKQRFFWLIISLLCTSIVYVGYKGISILAKPRTQN
ncbi:MAG: hypothetical protein LBB88_04455 [Planctomycetaceae bacterium]|jgi:hypothetical protein|nr:hypothetical protein [Planctomycetaceae bacterium]